MVDRQKLVVMLSRFPFPLEKGDKLRAFHQIKGLSKKFDVYLFALTDETVSENSKKELEPYCKEINVYPLLKTGIFIRLLFGIFKSDPLQVSYFFSKTISKNINAEIQRIAPDHIYCQLVRVASYVKDYHQCPKTLDYMDSLSKGIEKRIILAPFVLKWLFKLEHKRLKSFETRVFDYFENKTIISEIDRNTIFHPERNKVEIIPNGVNDSFFNTRINEPRFELVFIGNLSYAPNIETVDYISKFLHDSDYKCLIAGASPSRRVIKAANKCSQIELLGWFDDIREAYSLGKLFFAPMFIGTGMQNKLLEAMAAGIPCITTPQPAKAIGAIHKVNIVIAENDEEFRHWINLLLTDQEFYQRISENGKEYVKSNFSWDASVDLLLETCIC